MATVLLCDIPGSVFKQFGWYMLTFRLISQSLVVIASLPLLHGGNVTPSQWHIA